MLDTKAHSRFRGILNRVVFNLFVWTEKASVLNNVNSNAQTRAENPSVFQDSKKIYMKCNRNYVFLQHGINSHKERHINLRNIRNMDGYPF